MELKYMRPETNLDEKKGARPMSSIYTQLTESDFQLEKELSTLVPPPVAPVVLKPKLTGIKLSILACFTLGIASILGVIYVYESLLLEAKQRKTLESSHAALSERAVALETAVEEQKEIANQIRERMNRDSLIQKDIRKEIEKRHSEILELQAALKSIGGTETAVASTPAPAAATASIFGPTPPPVVAQPTPITTPESTLAPASSSVAGPAMSPTISQFRILTVNRQFKFVVINTGTENGSKVGDRYIVERAGKKVGAVQIEKLYDNFAAATISEENQNALLEVGDSITKVV